MAGGAFPPTHVAGGAVEGTVGAAAHAVEEQAYSPRSDALLGTVPLGETQNRKMNDLVTELREISGQVNRMMAQVDHAIHRLGVHTHAAAQLKR